MPQATDELRQKMERRFGDPIDSDGPTEFLMERGYKFNKGWISSPVAHEPTDLEADCIDFLVDEWDYAYTGIKEGPGTSSRTPLTNSMNDRETSST